jgi:hypothetical protein
VNLLVDDMRAAVERSRELAPKRVRYSPPGGAVRSTAGLATLTAATQRTAAGALVSVIA